MEENQAPFIRDTKGTLSAPDLALEYYWIQETSDLPANNNHAERVITKKSPTEAELFPSSPGLYSRPDHRIAQVAFCGMGCSHKQHIKNNRRQDDHC